MTAIEPTPPNPTPSTSAPASVSAPPPTEGDQQVGVRSAARGSALNLVGAVTAAVVSFVTIGFITNNYGTTGSGLFFTAAAVFTIAANGARLGGESGLTFFVSRFRAAGEQGALRSLVGTAVGATFAASAALGVVGVLGAPALADLLTETADNARTMTTMIRILAVAVPSFALSQVLFGATRGYGTMRPSVMTGQIFRPLAQMALVLLAIAVSSEIWPLAGAWAAASVVTAVLVGIWLWRRMHRHHYDRSPFDRVAYWRFAAPRAVTDLVSSALERLDILLVAYFLSQADVGLYGAASRLILAGQMMMFATSQSMAPLLSASFLQGRHADAKKLLNTITAWNIMILWPLLIALAFGAEPILGLFGDGFSDGASVVRVLAISLAVIVGLGPGDMLLLMTGDSVTSLVNHVVALVVLIGLSVVLLPEVGLIGAAWAWAASRLVLRCLSITRVWRTTRVHAFGRSVVLATVSAVIAFVPTGAIAYSLIDNATWALLTHLVVGGLIHLAIAVRFRNDLDYDQLVGVLARRSGKDSAGATP